MGLREVAFFEGWSIIVDHLQWQGFAGRVGGLNEGAIGHGTTAETNAEVFFCINLAEGRREMLRLIP